MRYYIHTRERYTLKVIMIYLKGEDNTTNWAQELEIHRKYLVNSLEGKIVAIGPFTDNTGGLVIVEAETIDEIVEVAKNDPAVVSNTLSYEVHPWSPFKGVFN